jgi:hypothetical protein
MKTPNSWGLKGGILAAVNAANNIKLCAVLDMASSEGTVARSMRYN